jgi:para-nitrobenzyl esterase
MVGLSPGAPASRVVVEAACGTVRGILDHGVEVFKGIPYAAAPEGDLRFAPPQPAVQGDIDATGYGAISLQDIDPLAEALPGAEQNFYALGVKTAEDCLNLNVWTADRSGKAPVYVYIHGGAFLYGSGTGAWIDGARHAREHGIVVVTLNYRLGLLGGLWLGDVDLQAANLGLQDQIQALRWVRENIAAFGGDPELVTIGGESAGAMSVCGLLTAPAARGLFARAVVESGHADAAVSLEDARRSTSLVLDRLHVDAAGDVLAQLRALSTPRILAVQRELGVAVRAFPLVMDGVVLPQNVLGAIEDGVALGIDLIIGTTSEENRLFGLTGWAAPTRSIADAVADLLPAGPVRDEAIERYTALAAMEGLDAQAIGHLIVTDHAWIEPTRTTAAAHAFSGGRTFHFELAWHSSVPEVGAAHLIDLPFFMGNLDAPGVSELLGDEVVTDPATIALGTGVSAALAAFVRTGDPSTPELGPWPAFTLDERSTMVLDRRSEIVVDRIADRLDFWSAQRGVSSQPLATIGAAE